MKGEEYTFQVISEEDVDSVSTQRDEVSSLIADIYEKLAEKYDIKTDNDSLQSFSDVIADEVMREIDDSLYLDRQEEKEEEVEE